MKQKCFWYHNKPMSATGVCRINIPIKNIYLFQETTIFLWSALQKEITKLDFSDSWLIESMWFENVAQWEPQVPLVTKFVYPIRPKNFPLRSNGLCQKGLLILKDALLIASILSYISWKVDGDHLMALMYHNHSDTSNGDFPE